MSNEGTFVNGKYVDSTSNRLVQKVEIHQQTRPCDSHIYLNGRELQCKEYSVRQDARSFGEITLKLPINEVVFVSESSVLYIEWNGMKFERVQ